MPKGGHVKSGTKQDKAGESRTNQAQSRINQSKNRTAVDDAMCFCMAYLTDCLDVGMYVCVYLPMCSKVTHFLLKSWYSLKQQNMARQKENNNKNLLAPNSNVFFRNTTVCSPKYHFICPTCHCIGPKYLCIYLPKKLYLPQIALYF